MPWGVTIDDENNHLIVSDCNNHRIQVFDFEGTFMFKFGSEGTDKGQFRYPKGVARAPNGHIMVADSNNHRVQVFNEDGRFIRKFGSFGMERPGLLNHPCGVACTPGELVIVTEQDNHRVQLFNVNGEPVRQFGTQGFSKGQFIYPHHVCVNQRGRIIIADCVNDRVQVFDLEGKYLSDFGKEGKLLTCFKENFLPKAFSASRMNFSPEKSCLSSKLRPLPGCFPPKTWILLKAGRK